MEQVKEERDDTMLNEPKKLCIITLLYSISFLISFIPPAGIFLIQGGAIYLLLAPLSTNHFRTSNLPFPAAEMKFSLGHASSRLSSLPGLNSNFPIPIQNFMAKDPKWGNFGKYTRLQVFQGCRIGKMEDNLTSADPLSYTTNGSRVDLEHRVSVSCRVSSSWGFT